MNRTDANAIALRALAQLLHATPSEEFVVAGKQVRLHAERLPTIGWPRQPDGSSKALDGLDENRDGPWPPSLRIACKWDGGGTILLASADFWRTVTGSNRHYASLRIGVADHEQELLWVTIPGLVQQAADGETAKLIAWASIRGRKGDSPELIRRLNQQLKDLLAGSGLERTAPTMVQLGSVEVPSGQLRSSPQAVLDAALHLALLKLPILARDTTSEGVPLFVANTTGASLPIELPAPSRRAAVYMLPGGVREYKQTLDAILEQLDQAPLSIDAFDRLLHENYEITGKSALSSYRHLLVATGLVDEVDDSLTLSSAGQDYLLTKDPLQLFRVLDTRFTGIFETLAITRIHEPVSVEVSNQALCGLLDTTWQTTMQAGARRNWLLSLGMTERTPDGDVVTPLGRKILESRLEELAAIEGKLSVLPAHGVAIASTPPESTALAERVLLTAEMLQPHLGKLRLPEEALEQACAALSAGSHLLLVGPPGTGKTELALALGEAARAQEICTGIRCSTASADWTTFETIGGYALEPSSSGESLVFRSGVFLQALEAQQWLLIDELNRADVDRAFGELMTVLSGKGSVLPYRGRDGRAISVGKNGDPHQPAGGWTHPLPPTFRLIASMNTWDKTSLFRLSHALQRRFAVLHVGIPEDAVYAELLRMAAGSTGHDSPLVEGATDRLVDLFRRSALLGHLEVGPAIPLDMVRYMRRRGGDGRSFAEAISLYLLPQLEGLGRHAAREVNKLLLGALQGWAPVPAIAALEAHLAELHPEADA